VEFKNHYQHTFSFIYLNYGLYADNDMFITLLCITYSMNYGMQYGTNVEAKIVHTNSELFRAGMMFCCKDKDSIKYSFGDPNQ